MMTFTDFDILYEDSYILVCRKPAGIAVQSARMGTPDMESLLKNYLYQTAKEKKEPYLAIIHRLDQPVEGVLVFAKTPFAARELSKDMQKGGFGKHYRALVCGYPPKESDTIENYMIKDGRTNMSRICPKDTPGAKLATLSYSTVIQNREFPVKHGDASALASEFSISSTADTIKIPFGTTLLDVILDTGRHHQIRVQLAGLGCPIVGDRKYGLKNAPQNPELNFFEHKLNLCAYELTFHHPKSKNQMTFHF